MRGPANAGRRGFSLIELLVVVVIIGVMAALAVPSLRLATFDRHAYDDAGAIMQLFRSAKTRAIARGGAVLVGMHANFSAGDRGTFMMYEAVTANAGSGAGPAIGTPASPVSSCKFPTIWNPLPAAGAPNPGIILLDSVNLNGQPEADANIQTTLNIYIGTAATAFNDGFICFTPLGRSYAVVGVAFPTFTNLPNNSPIEAVVTRGTQGTARSVLIPPTGMARLYSHVL